MSTILLRFGKRRTAWSPSTPLEQLLQAEFRSKNGKPDLRPSVYEIESARPTLVRAHAEHTAGNALNPPNGFVNFDLTGWRVVEVSDGACHFEFASKAHRELVFEDEAKLAEFIGSLLEERRDREYVTKRADLVAYAASRIGSNDAEWLAFCSKCTASHGKVWRCPNP